MNESVLLATAEISNHELGSALTICHASEQVFYSLPGCRGSSELSNGVVNLAVNNIHCLPNRYHIFDG
jgi:hypothetical protein